MNLFKKLQERAATGNPIRVGMIGAGKFGTMFLAQALRIPAIHVVGVVDLNPVTAKSNMKLVGWTDDSYSAADLDDAIRLGKSPYLAMIGRRWSRIRRSIS